MSEEALSAVPDRTLGEASGAALFILAVAILCWPLARRLLEARRQRAQELRIASGLGAEQRK